MSYKDIPDCFQPISIANNRYTFSDGVYSLETDRLLLQHEEIQSGSAVRTLQLIAPDDTATDPDPPCYLNGIRRVRNVRVDVDLLFDSSTLQKQYMAWILDVIVIRQGQLQAFSNDILATASGVNRSTEQAIPEKDDENLSICYPGYVDLNGGDQLVVRLSLATQDSSQFYYSVSLDASCLVRFG